MGLTYYTSPTTQIYRYSTFLEFPDRFSRNARETSKKYLITLSPKKNLLLARSYSTHTAITPNQRAHNTQTRTYPLKIDRNSQSSLLVFSHLTLRTPNSPRPETVTTGFNLIVSRRDFAPHRAKHHARADQTLRSTAHYLKVASNLRRPPGQSRTYHTHV